jgi:hypothetical protein
VPNITVEHTLMIPILLIQVFLFPIAVKVMTSTWTDARRQNVLQDAADHLSSIIQQLYFCLNRTEISAGNITQASTLPRTVESYPYTAVVDSLVSLGSDSSKVLTLTLTLEQAGNTATASVIVGPKVEWDEDSPAFRSNSPQASIKVQKFENGTLLFSFG